uniref:Uncharacterized protein n=1 Tax=Anguilla anguilla TaxID=7936 RepID=A0A0E9UTE7_ANGAN
MWLCISTKCSAWVCGYSTQCRDLG